MPAPKFGPPDYTHKAEEEKKEPEIKEEEPKPKSKKEGIIMETKPIKMTENEIQREKLLEKATAIKKEFGGLESDIPVPHEYWDLMNRYRSLLMDFQEGKV